MKITNIDSFESFDALYKQCEQVKGTDDKKNLIFLFVASEDPETKQSWCSDCRLSKPIIDKVIEEFKFNELICLVIVSVGTKEEWKKDDNPYRIHALQISAVPTLYSVTTGMRLIEGECADAVKVAHVFSHSL